MNLKTAHLSRRTFVKLSGIAAAAHSVIPSHAQTANAALPLFDGKTLDGWIQLQNKPESPSPAWIAKDGAMASTGSGRGVIYTARDFTHYRLTFIMRHVSGSPDHQACILIFCTRPQTGEKPLDALGGIQFQVPNGGHWDYRPGRNDAGGPEFTTINKPQFDPHQWSRVELLVDATKGTALMSVAQPPEGKAVEVLSFTDASAGKTGPIAWQMHNAGIFDEYKDVTIELNPGES